MDCACCTDRYSSRFKNNYFTKMCSDSEEGSYLRLIDVELLNSRLESNNKEKVVLNQCGWAGGPNRTGRGGTKRG